MLKKKVTVLTGLEVNFLIRQEKKGLRRRAKGQGGEGARGRSGVMHHAGRGQAM